MKKEYIEPKLEALRLEELQELLTESLVTAAPEETTDEMDAKQGWFNTDWE
jgi:hypothetical protein